MLGGRKCAVHTYLKATEDVCRGVIQVDPATSEASISEAIYSPDAPVWGEAIPVRLYRKTTPVCIQCGTVGHLTDVCPNPNVVRCSTCRTLNPEAGHECQAKCSVCNGAHITGSVECKWKYRRAIGGQRERSLVRNTDIPYSQGPHNINPRRSSASPSRRKNGKAGLPDTPSAHPETGTDNHRNKVKESSHPAARDHPPGKKDKDPNQVSWADIAAPGPFHIG
ncbi:hypothetical protein MTO96_020048 [Rhipicephalus appendiculatus]